ncbi:MAG: sugar-binding domain-containing protein [Victivallales bacterium]|jgi:beta-galactosidase
MRIKILIPALLLLFSEAVYAGQFFTNGPREEMNLAGKDWQEAVSDTLDMTKIPENLSWVTAKLPTVELSKKLKSADNQWSYCTVSPDKYFNDDGAFKVKEKLSAWYRKSVDIPEGLLKNHTVHLTVAGASYRSAVIVNGKPAGESIQSMLPLDFDITKFVRAGKNELAIGITTREGLIDPKAKVYIAPSMGASPGIRGPVRLEFRPMIAVDDVFVKTSVKNKNIDFQMTIVNNGTAEAEVTPKVKVRSVRDPRQVVGEFSGKPLKIAAAAETGVNISENWVAPILWSLSTPEMYMADVSLYAGDKLVDSYRQTFGFREFSVKDKDFLLNGKRVVLLRDSSLNSLKTLEDNPDEISITQKNYPVNSIRQHLGCYNSDLIHRANSAGIMVVPESAYSWVHIYPQAPEKAKVWLPGVLDYYKRWARHLRNEPSVVMYSLVNETYWGRNLPDEMAVCRQIVDVMRKEDPTRPLQGDGENSWNGLLDVINIHYPEGTAGTLRLKYPNSSIMLPNDIEWLKPEGGEGWNTKFKWDRPLVLGEFGGGGDSESYSSFGGDDIYNWIKWKKNTRSGPDFGASDKERSNYYVEILRKMINYYRHIGVAGLNPWAGDKNELLKAMAVAPMDFHPNVDAGGVFKRKLAVFNDERRPVNKIKYYLTVNGSLVCDAEKSFYLDPGQKWSGDIEIPVPDLGYPAKAEFVVRLIWTRGKNDVEVDRHVENIFIIPGFNLSGLTKDIAVIDPGNSMKKVFGEIKLDNLETVKDNVIPAGKKLLIVGVDGFSNGMDKMLDKFVEDGGVVLMLPQKDWKPYRVELPERDSQHAATQAWARLPGHPALRDVEEAQLSYWGDDNVVSFETFKKPQQGPLNVVIDAGGRFGLRWSPLLDIPVGKGSFLMTTLELAKQDPAARQIMANLIEYGCSRKPANHVKLNLLAGKNSALSDALRLTGVQISEGIGAAGPVLIDSSAEFKADALRDALGQGRTVWLHNFTPETFSKIATLMPVKSELLKVPKELVGTMPVVNDDLIKGIANYDFAWYIPKLYYGGPLFDSASVVAKTGDWVLNTNMFAKDVKQLTDPAFLVKINSGSGTILFDTLQWEHAIGKEADKALRIASGILTNLNCDFKFGKKVSYKCTFVDFAKFANMGFMDGKADDGVGGWTDQGRNDMRFFLINHSGKGSGEEDGMEVPVPPFPTDVDFNGVLYKLIDPKANGNKAVLSFGSKEHAPKLMREAGPIPVNAKADVMWFLHALGWGGGKDGGVVAEYTLEYGDGAKTTIPIRRFIDIGDWFNPSLYPNASIAWTGKNLTYSPVGVNTMPWKNPHPEKTIKSLSIKAGLDESQYVLIAITCGVKSEDAGNEEGKVEADFNFEKKNFNSELFPAAKLMPVQNESGMQFANGTQLSFNAKKAGLQNLLKKPFSIKFDLTATDKPDGYCAGLVETQQFRITLAKGTMKVTVETNGFDGKKLYISSTYPVELNKRVMFEYKSDGKKGVLLRDGKIDTIVDVPLPGNEIESVRFGVAGGKDYNFNGILHRVAFKSHAGEQESKK